MECRANFLARDLVVESRLLSQRLQRLKRSIPHVPPQRCSLPLKHRHPQVVDCGPTYFRSLHPQKLFHSGAPANSPRCGASSRWEGPPPQDDPSPDLFDVEDEPDEEQDRTDEELAEQEFEALAAAWKQMIELGAVPAGGIPGVKDLEEKFPGLKGAFPYMAGSDEPEDLDTPYPYVPAPEIPEEALQRVRRTQSLLRAVLEHLPCLFRELQVSDSAAAEPLGEVLGEEAGSDGEDELEAAAAPAEGDSGRMGVARKSSGQTDTRRLQGDGSEAPPAPRAPQSGDEQAEISQALTSEPEAEDSGSGAVPESLPEPPGAGPLMDVASGASAAGSMRDPGEAAAGEGASPLSWVHEVFSKDAKFINPLFCYQGPERFQHLVEALRRTGAEIKVHQLYSQSLVETPDESEVVAQWTVLLTRRRSFWMQQWGLEAWWEQQLPLVLQDILGSLPQEDQAGEEGAGEEGTRSSNRGAQGRPAPVPFLGGDEGGWGAESAPMWTVGGVEGAKRLAVGPAAGEDDKEEDEEEEESPEDKAMWEDIRKALEFEAELAAAEEAGNVLDTDVVGLCGETKFKMNAATGKVTSVRSEWWVLDEEDGELALAMGQLFLQGLLISIP